MINIVKGKGLFIFSDPGGAKPVLSFIYNKKIKNYKIISDRKYNFFNDFNLKVENYNIKSNNELFKAYKPDYVFTGTSYTSKIELKFISKAKDLNIKTYTFIDHYSRYKDRFKFNGVYIFPDVIFLTDNKAKKIAYKAGLNLYSKIFISGNFFHEYLNKWKPKISKKIFFSSFKINNNQKIILFAPDPLSNIDGKKVLLFDETDVWIDLSKAINKISLTSNPLLIIKFHPNQNINYLKRIVKEFPVKKYLFVNSTNTNELIYYSNIVVGIYSSLLIEAEKLKKNILRHIPNPKIDDYLDHLKKGKISNTVNELANNLKLFI
ncbi:MAG: hypothetical protein CMC88_04100 [Flavobacteriaceae bacterium]|nr:hypothetical protein [Flavobacteriaceae bacterium]|tara:strand:- start:83857 stop:84819 length:963 start_codon:yes stop_codon:yes gene_type:complete